MNEALDRRNAYAKMLGAFPEVRMFDFLNNEVF